MERLIRRTPSSRHLELLARLEERQQLPDTFAPDFCHGDFILEHAYALLDSPDTQAFIVLDEHGAGIGLFEDYFLTVHTHSGQHDTGSFLTKLCASHPQLESVMILDLRSSSTPTHLTLPVPVTLHAHLTRHELSTLESELYHVIREQRALDATSTRLQNDVLSLIAIASRAHSSLASQAA